MCCLAAADDRGRPACRDGSRTVPAPWTRAARVVSTVRTVVHSQVQQWPLADNSNYQRHACQRTPWQPFRQYRNSCSIQYFYLGIHNRSQERSCGHGARSCPGEVLHGCLQSPTLANVYATRTSSPPESPANTPAGARAPAKNVAWSFTARPRRTTTWGTPLAWIPQTSIVDSNGYRAGREPAVLPQFPPQTGLPPTRTRYEHTDPRRPRHLAATSRSATADRSSAKWTASIGVTPRSTGRRRSPAGAARRRRTPRRAPAAARSDAPPGPASRPARRPRRSR